MPPKVFKNRSALRPYTRIGIEQLGSPAHHDLAYDIASQGLILLQNPPTAAVTTDTSAILPLAAKVGGKTLVVGPHANSTRALLGSYFDQACPPSGGAGGTNVEGHDSPFGCVETPLHAIGSLLAPVRDHQLMFEPGCADLDCARDPSLIRAASAAAGQADQVVVLLGIDEHFEGEGHDRTDTALPGAQAELLMSVAAAADGKPAVVVFLNGGIVSVDSLPSLRVAAVEAWYPGIRGSAAIADALFGRTNRFGKPYLYGP